VNLSICILNFNTRDLLEASLKSIYESTRDLDFEVIICDNASVDGSADMVRQKFPQVKLIANAENRYFTRSNNQMFKIATGDYLFIMAGDVALEGDIMARLVAYLIMHPDVGAATPQIKVGTTCSRYSPWLFSALDRTFLHMLFPGLYRRLQDHFLLKDWNRDVEREVEVASDSALMVRKSLIDSIGGFDEGLLLYYTEEDLCRMIWNRTKYRIMYVPIPSVIHLEHQSVRQVDPVRIRQIWWRDMKYYHRKWDGLIPWLILTLIGWINTPVYKIGYLRTQRAKTRPPETTFTN
jgi:GT2 family glycosyltransferase